MEATAYIEPLEAKKPINTLIFFQVVIGSVAVFVPPVAIIFIVIFVLYSVLKIIQTGNRDNYAAFAAVYLASAEMLLRLSGKFIAYEFGKYSVIIVLVIGMLVEKNTRKIPSNAVLYFILLLPSITVAHYASAFAARTFLSFNLSGPLTLAVGWLYFSERKFNKKELTALFLNMILPIISLVPNIILKIPTNVQAVLTTQSNKLLSGGFSPNQVSIVLGFGAFVMALSILLKLQLTSSRYMDFVLMFAFLAFSALTFSRGGTLTGIAAFAASTYVYIRTGRASRQMSRIFFGLVIFIAAAYFVWQALNAFTGNIISERYIGTVEVRNEAKGKVDLSGRDDLISQDLETFRQNIIMGAGPSGSMAYRAYKYNNDLVAHTEFTRLLGDHGLFGVLAILILVSNAMIFYRKSKDDNKIILIGFTVMCFLTLAHAAMRLAIPGLAFGLALIKVNLTENPLEKAD